MGRKPTITKEQIFEAAWKILEAEGYAAVNIKTVAKEAGCSTQPVSWLFGNMGVFRNEFRAYCIGKLWGDIDSKMQGKDPVEAFFETGKNYLSIACDHPNVFRFLYLEDPGDLFPKGVTIIDVVCHPKIISMMAREFGRDEESLSAVVRDTVIYTHGLAAFMLWDMISLTKEEAEKMIYDEGVTKLRAIGIEIGERK